MSGHGTAAVQANEAREFLQHRLARFGLYGSSIGWFFLAIRLVKVIGNVGDGELASLVLHTLGAASLLTLWVVCRTGARSNTFLRSFDVGAMVVGCTFYALMGLELPAWSMPHYIVLLSLSFGLITRSIYVPSPATTTFVLAVLAGVPLVVVTYVLYGSVGLTLWRQVAPELNDLTSAQVALNITIFTTAWWLATIAICTGASRVIYGLRSEVRSARRLGQYTVVEKLGEGGMGIVYRAKHAMLRRPTAIKLLPAGKAGEHSLARFEKEVQLTSLLSHSNTITVFDYPATRISESGSRQAVTALERIVEGTGPLSAAHVVQVLDQAAGALGEAHGIGLIHRDIKPANIMLVSQGGKPDVAKVLDFGLVKELDPIDVEVRTKADAITGTPQYLPPEAITSPKEIDGRSDLYALGRVGYFLLTGEHVFTGKTLVEICSAHLDKEPVPPTDRTENLISPELEGLILACLAKSPGDRPADAAMFCEMLAACPESGAWTAQAAADWWANVLEPTRASPVATDAIEGSERPGLTIDVDLARLGQVGR